MSQTLWPAKPGKVDRSLFRRPKKDKNHNLSWYKEYIMHIQRLLRDRFWQLVDKLGKKVLLALYKLLASWFFRHIRKNGRKEHSIQGLTCPVQVRAQSESTTIQCLRGFQIFWSWSGPVQRFQMLSGPSPRVSDEIWVWKESVLDSPTDRLRSEDT